MTDRFVNFVVIVKDVVTVFSVVGVGIRCCMSGIVVTLVLIILAMVPSVVIWSRVVGLPCIRYITILRIVPWMLNNWVKHCSVGELRLVFSLKLVRRVFGVVNVIVLIVICLISTVVVQPSRVVSLSMAFVVYCRRGSCSMPEWALTVLTQRSMIVPCLIPWD